MSNSTPLKSLEAHYYTDPAIFAQEQKDCLARTWQFAMHSAEIPNTGDYKVFDIAGESLFCVRCSDTEIKAYYNVCQHRAHQLVQDQGNTKCLICPYHAWSYELTGEFRGAPNIGSVMGLDKTSIRLCEVRLENFCGFLFANLDDSARPMDEWFPGVREELSDFVPHISQLFPTKWIEIPEKCNWKVSVENYSECYHCQLNHPTFANGIVKARTYEIQAQGYCLRHTTECQNLDKMTYPVDLTSNSYAGQYSSWFLWPMMSFQVYPGNVLNTYHWRANDHANVTLWRGWYATDDTDVALIHELAELDRSTTVAEDIRLVESVQLGLNSRGYTPGPLVIDPNCGVQSEHSIAVLQGWMRDAIDG